jgi:ATP-dependent DNA helicase RecG
MNLSLDKLAKVLRLEVQRSFDNRAVLGGLQEMARHWQSEALSSGVPEGTVSPVVDALLAYGNLDADDRPASLKLVWGMLAEQEPTLAELNPFPPAPDIPAHTAETEQPKLDEEPVEPEAEIDEATEEPLEEAPASPPAAEPKGRKFEITSPLTAVPGIGPKSAKTLSKLGLETLGDLMWFLPRRYDDYSKLKPINRIWYGEEITVIGTVEESRVRPVRDGRMQLVEAVISDGTGSIRVTWFNQPWIANQLRPGRAVVLSGRVDQYLGKLTMNSPEWEPLERQQLHTNRIVPVYPLTAGVTAKWLRRVTDAVVGRLAPRIPDPLPESVRDSAGLLPLSVALQQVHFPDGWEQLAKAQHRLAFDEMFMLQLGVLRQKREWSGLTGTPMPVSDEWLAQFTSALPYALTNAQRTCLEEIRKDMSSPRLMNRLLQGDVGSGKTVLAAAAIGMCASHSWQSAMLAPTSILADQHYRTLRNLLPKASGIEPDRIALLTGGTPDAAKAEIRQGLASGSILLVVGTHALLEEPVVFARLGLAVIDEQHRFGVEQRAQIRSKGTSPNLLVMSATPIPRSLALTLYGDLDLSVLDEMPPGRSPVETRVLHPIERSRAHQFAEGQLESGRQVYIIYPLVEESEKTEARAAVEEAERLQKEIFTRQRLCLLHGRMRADEKDAVMEEFRAGRCDVLVSTSVVEVGLDVPNATVMIIEGANRFGLAQLHQFRGRVGRGEAKSYCLLIPDQDEETENERLRALESTHDGFALAEMDLGQRGPGDFLGTRQSGFGNLRMARLTDIRLIDKARKEALRMFESDPDLADPDHRLLAKAMETFWTSEKGEMS